MGLYSYSPADDDYIVSVPLFNTIELNLGADSTIKIIKQNNGKKINDILIDGKAVEGYFVSHDQLKNGKELLIKTE